MSDFILTIGRTAIDAAPLLQARPGMQNCPVDTTRFSWGTLAVQRPRSTPHAPRTTDAGVTFCIGRPRVVGRVLHADAPGFCDHVTDWFRADDWARRYASLSGMFVIGQVDEQRIELLTDPMGTIPVYLATQGALTVIGSQPEVVARIAGRATDFDPVSLAEILVRRVPIFPYTTRRGMRELAPGSLHQLRPGEDLQTRTLWQPNEVDGPTDDLVDALRFAARDLSEGARRTGVLLSGGADSRTVLGALPAERRTDALTFADDAANYEVKLAARIARAADVQHHVVQRAADFYARLGAREAQLLGLERAPGNAHGLALLDAGGWGDDEGLLIGGFLCDSLLKGYWKTSDDAWQPPAETLKTVRPELAEALLARSAERFEAVKALRPTTAAEWFWMYPASRQTDMGHAHVLQRLFVADELFLHRRILDIAVRRPDPQRLTQVKSAFRTVAGALADVPNANTGLRLDAPGWQESVGKRLLKLRARAGRMFLGRPSWYGVGAWPRMGEYLDDSPDWAQVRQAAMQANQSAEIIDTVLRDPVAHCLALDRRTYGTRFARALTDLALHVETVLRSAP